MRSRRWITIRSCSTASSPRVEISTENLALTRESYSAGNSGVLQVLEAQRQNQQARLGPGASAGDSASGHRAAAAGARR